ncbi:hypothetical protein HYU40_00915 [Candidatus Woesearchaeota archaeon]|nr:hypothetical protein [Candidatus Woesearchaeota archaeon]
MIKTPKITKIKSPLEKVGMLGKEEGFTTVKELLWRYGNKCIGLVPEIKGKGLKPFKAEVTA